MSKKIFKTFFSLGLFFLTESSLHIVIAMDDDTWGDEITPKNPGILPPPVSTRTQQVLPQNTELKRDLQRKELEQHQPYNPAALPPPVSTRHSKN